MIRHDSEISYSNISSGYLRWDFAIVASDDASKLSSEYAIDKGRYIVIIVALVVVFLLCLGYCFCFAVDSVYQREEQLVSILLPISSKTWCSMVYGGSPLISDRDRVTSHRDHLQVANGAK